MRSFDGKLLINGKWVAASNGATEEIKSPFNGNVAGIAAVATLTDVESAIASAVKGAEVWRRTPAHQRSAILMKAAALADERSEEIAQIISSENGKSLLEARGEAGRSGEIIRLGAFEGSQLYGTSLPLDANKGTGQEKLGFTLRQPVGVVVAISPFNYPALLVLHKLAPALGSGNSVVLKPARATPLTALALAQCFTDAGLPDGVLNVITGAGGELGDALVSDPRVRKISFTGSTATGTHISRIAGVKKLSLELGASSPVVVLPDADLDLAADQAINAGFGSAGERCMAISALVAVEPVADELIKKIVERMSKLKTGDGSQDADMGPLVTAVHRDKVASYVETGVKEGAKLVVDGRNPQVNGAANGFWLGPTLFDNVTPEMTIYKDEIFGPVLSVIRVKSYDEGLALINSHRYGNGTAIFTNDGGAARRFQYEVNVGMVGINVPIPVPTAYYSFGGWKSSLFGDTHAHGTEGIHFFTRGKVVTSRWLDPSHGGINLGFPQNR